MKNRKHVWWIMLFLFTGSILFFVSAEKVFAVDKKEITWRMVPVSGDFTMEEALLTAKIYRSRLINLGIKEKDFSVSPQGKKMIVVTVKNMEVNSEKYRDITKALAAEGHLAFWETFENYEVQPVLHAAFEKEAEWIKFLKYFAKRTGYDSALIPLHGPKIGYAGDSAAIRIKTIADSLHSVKKLPANMQFGWCRSNEEGHKDLLEWIALKSDLDGMPVLDKPKLNDASLAKGAHTTPEISMTMDSVSAVKWALITKANAGRCIAMVYDGMVISYPTVMGEITGGRSQISGNFALKEAAEIVMMLKTEPLPVRMSQQH